MACADRPPRRHCSVVIRPCCRARRSSTERCCDERGVGTSSAPATDGCIGVRSPNGGQRRGRRPQARSAILTAWIDLLVAEGVDRLPVLPCCQPVAATTTATRRSATAGASLPGACRRRAANRPRASMRTPRCTSAWRRTSRRYACTATARSSSAGSPGPGRPRRPPPRPPGAKGRSVSCSVCSSCGRNAAGRQCRATVNRNRDEAALYQVPSSWSTKACTDATCGWSIAAQSVWGATCTAGMPAARAPLTSKCTESPR